MTRRRTTRQINMKSFITRLLFVVALSASFAGTTACDTAACCKRCRTGKPCGDSCIANNQTCHVTGGCAC